MRNLDNPLIIISSNTDDYFQRFIDSSSRGFYLELKKMIQDNDAKNFHSWFTERSYLSLFFNAVIRNDKDNKKTVIQEYSVASKCDDDKGRCDGLINDEKKVILFEAKAFSRDYSIRSDHFEVEPWLAWDGKIRNQFEWYFEQDREFFLDKNRYEHCYLATIVFKIIYQVPESFSREAESKLKPEVENSYSRQWYYSLAFFDDSESNEKFYGIELYGTVVKVPEQEFQEMNALPQVF